MIRILITMLLIISFGYSTEQIEELVNYKGEMFYSRTSPVFPFIQGKGNYLKEAELNTANYKGFVGHYLIRNDSLFVTQIKVSKVSKASEKYGTVINSINLMDSLFESNDPKFCHWYTGQFEIHNDSVLKSEYPGFHRDYELETAFDIIKGKVIEKVTINRSNDFVFQSKYDQFRIGLSKEKKSQDWNWIDLRSAVHTNAKGMISRGRLMSENSFREIEIPNTSGTHILIARIQNELEDPYKLFDGAVEFKIVDFTVNKSGLLEIKIKIIRELDSNESIHHKDYKIKDKPYSAI